MNLLSKKIKDVLMYGKKVKVFLKGQAKKRYLELKNRNDKGARIVFNSIENTKNHIKDNPQYGSPLSKRLIPIQLTKQGIQNIYRIELSNFWRLLYTLETDGITIFVFILYIVNHKEYNKLLGYK